MSSVSFNIFRPIEESWQLGIAPANGNSNDVVALSPIVKRSHDLVRVTLINGAALWDAVADSEEVHVFLQDEVSGQNLSRMGAFAAALETRIALCLVK